MPIQVQWRQMHQYMLQVVVPVGSVHQGKLPDVINDKVTADTAKTPSTSTKSPFTNAITGNQMASTSNTVTRTTQPPTNHHYVTCENSFVGICNDRRPAESLAKPQGHLKPPPNIVQASVAKDGRAKQNFVQ